MTQLLIEWTVMKRPRDEDVEHIGICVCFLNVLRRTLSTKNGTGDIYVGHQVESIPLKAMGCPNVETLYIGTFFIPM